MGKKVKRSRAYTALKEAIGRAPNELVWTYLESEGKTSDVFVMPTGIEDLVDDYRKLEDFFVANRRSERPQRPNQDPREMLLGQMDKLEPIYHGEFVILPEITGAILNEHPGVQEFRRIHMGNVLVDVTKVRDWIQKHAEADGSPTQWIQAVIKEDGTLVPAATTSGFKRKTEKLTYTYEDPGRDRLEVDSVDINLDGTLGHLWRLVEDLKVNVGCDPEWCALYILSGNALGLIKPFESVNITNHFYRLAAHASVRLDLNLGLSPAEVADIYALHRELAATTAPHRYSFSKARTALRSMRERTLVLAITTVTAVLNDDETDWLALAQAWNERHREDRPDWCYRLPEHLGNFKRDARNAFERIVGTDADGVRQWLRKWNPTPEPASD